MALNGELFLLELNLHPNEASGLLTMGDDALLEEHGWDLGFWVVLDEGEIEACVAAIGHRRGSPEGEGWEIERLRARRPHPLRHGRGRAPAAYPPARGLVLVAVLPVMRGTLTRVRRTAPPHVLRTS